MKWWEIWISSNDPTWKGPHEKSAIQSVQKPYIQIPLLIWILFSDLCPDYFHIWFQNNSPDRQTLVEDVHVSLVDKNGFQFQLKSEEGNDETESDDDDDEELKLIFCADLDHSGLDWSKFLFPDGQLRFRIRMQIKEGQDSCSANQHPGGFSLGEDWNSGDWRLHWCDPGKITNPHNAHINANLVNFTFVWRCPYPRIRWWRSECSRTFA